MFFAIYAKIILLEKQGWLDDFIEKYNEPYDLHITLKQPCFINEIEVNELRNKVARFFKDRVEKKIKVDFRKFILDKPNLENSGCIMIGTSDNKKLLGLQGSIRKLLVDYSDYCDLKTKVYEENFVPHITIGNKLTAEKFEKALSELPQKLALQGTVDEIVLAIVNDESEAERKNPENLTTFRLI